AKSSSDTSSIVPSTATPALLTSRWQPPCAATTSRTSPSPPARSLPSTRGGGGPARRRRAPAPPPPPRRAVPHVDEVGGETAGPGPARPGPHEGSGLPAGGAVPVREREVTTRPAGGEGGGGP